MQRLILLMLAAVLAACSTVGPDYHRPEQALAQRDTANAAFVGGKEPVFAAAPVPANWWRLYHDATLDALGALNAGMQAAWLNRTEAIWPHDPQPHLIVSDLTELCDLLT